MGFVIANDIDIKKIQRFLNTEIKSKSDIVKAISELSEQEQNVLLVALTQNEEQNEKNKI